MIKCSHPFPTVECSSAFKFYSNMKVHGDSQAGKPVLHVVFTAVRGRSRAMLCQALGQVLGAIRYRDSDMQSITTLETRNRIWSDRTLNALCHQLTPKSKHSTFQAHLPACALHLVQLSEHPRAFGRTLSFDGWLARRCIVGLPFDSRRALIRGFGSGQFGAKALVLDLNL